MEIRVLRNFLEIAREESMTKAAAALHVSQPTLSKQMKELEQELGKKLFVRGNYSVRLTDEGMLLRKRAEDILGMVDKTAEEFKALDDIAGGEVYIGCAESHLVKHLARAIKRLQARVPNVRYHVQSGNTEQAAERLDRGLLDFAVIVEPPDLSKYLYLEVPGEDDWGVIMRSDSPLAAKESVTIDDLCGLPLLCSEQALREDFPRWCGARVDQLNIAGTFNLVYNASVFVREGLGYACSFDRLTDTSEGSGLCFRPLHPPLQTKMYVIWKKYQVFSPVAALLLEELQGLRG